jgi:predicted RNA-binding Zn ribbon-like protein
MLSALRLQLVKWVLMETDTGVARMRIVGGNVALDFVNTRSGPPAGPPDDDILNGYEDLLAWTRHVGLLTDSQVARGRRHARDDPDGARAMHERTLRIREDLDELFRAIATGQSPPARCLAALRDEEVDAIGHAQLVTTDGRFEWRWLRGDDLGRPIWPVIHSAAGLLTTGPLDRIKDCAGCRFLFVDESKNRSRRWCNMEDCGTAAKIRRYVARRAAARG